MVKEKKTKMVWVRMTESEFQKLKNDSKNYSSVSDYIRLRIFRNGAGLTDPREFIRVMDEILTEMKRVGNNINQFAKYVNTVENISSEHIIEEFDKEINAYVAIENKLNTSWRKLIKLV